MINIRKSNLEDAECLSFFIKQLDNESQYLLYDKDERKNDINTTKSYLEKIQNIPRNVVFIAENECCEIVGFVCGEVSPLKKINHVMKGNIGVLKKYHGKSIGRLLVEKLLSHAERMGIIRIEASIIKENVNSLNLCKKFGFEVEGVKRNSIKIGEKFHDEYFISKIINHK